jgi:hypothetical protein
MASAYVLRLSVIGWLTLASLACSRHYVMDVPKEPEEERAMQPYANSVWIHGEWEWRKDHHEFKGGYYDLPHRGSEYLPGKWISSAKGYYYKHGHWKRSAGPDLK